MKDVGALVERLGSDSMRKFEQCWLCLKTAQDPCCNTAGYLFCRNCIIENLGEQKEKMSARLEKWNVETEKVNGSIQDEEVREKRKILTKFLESEEKGTVSKKLRPDKLKIKEREDPFIWKETDPLRWKTTSFWVAESQPDHVPAVVEKPKGRLECPISGTPMRLKELVAIHPDVDESGKWLCAVSQKIISCQKAVLVIPTGNVVLEECLEKCVFGKSGFHSREITKKDIRPLQSGGTGFAFHNTVEAKIDRPSMT
eukprot:GHVP01051590.1.p2 GENE.GHVP01051590.1~~GHVP01051590.1.p2  ORF type:complete len:288 (+),score=50.07 GHVP01051590.1:97-864(+)